MSKLPNPFDFGDAPCSPEKAAACSPQVPSCHAAADLSDSDAQDWRPDEAAALVRQDGAAVDLIAEIFVGARKLNLPRFKLDEEQFMSDIEEPPLFLRQAG